MWLDRPAGQPVISLLCCKSWSFPSWSSEIQSLHSTSAIIGKEFVSVVLGHSEAWLHIQVLLIWLIYLKISLMRLILVSFFFLWLGYQTFFYRYLNHHVCIYNIHYDCSVSLCLNLFSYRNCLSASSSFPIDKHCIIKELKPLESLADLQQVALADLMQTSISASAG